METPANLPNRMDQLEILRSGAPTRIDAATTVDELETVEAETVGRQSPIAAARRSLGAIDDADERRIEGQRINDLALWFTPDADSAQVQQRLRELDRDTGLLEFSATPELRAISLAIFDRSFAVTYYLQAVAIAIGLVGVAASMSAQVLARRKEFGLLSHLGLTRAQVIGVVAGEGAAWLAAGALIGLLLGLAVSVVLVHVVDPQSFHWTMQLRVPWGNLLALCAAVLLAGIGTAAYSARAAASRAALLSVKEDW